MELFKSIFEFIAEVSLEQPPPDPKRLIVEIFKCENIEHLNEVLDRKLKRFENQLETFHYNSQSKDKKSYQLLQLTPKLFNLSSYQFKKDEPKAWIRKNYDENYDRDFILSSNEIIQSKARALLEFHEAWELYMKFLEEVINLISEAFKATKSRKKIKSIYKISSNLKVNSDYYMIKENKNKDKITNKSNGILKDFKYNLQHSKLIQEGTSIVVFRQLIDNRPTTGKIKWIGNQKEFADLFNQLIKEKKLLKCVTEDTNAKGVQIPWENLCQIFVFKDKNGKFVQKDHHKMRQSIPSFSSSVIYNIVKYL